MVTSPLFWGSELFCGVTQNGWWWIRVQLGLTAPPPPLDGDSLKLTPWCCHKHWLARLLCPSALPTVHTERPKQLSSTSLSPLGFDISVPYGPWLDLSWTFNRQRRCDRPIPIRKMTIKRQCLAGKEEEEAIVTTQC